MELDTYRSVNHVYFHTKNNLVSNVLVNFNVLITINLKFVMDLIISTYVNTDIMHTHTHTYIYIHIHTPMHIYPNIHPLTAIYRFSRLITTNEYLRIKYHINVKRLFLHSTLHNFRSLQFPVSISIEFQTLTPICSTHTFKSPNSLTELFSSPENKISQIH